MKRFLLLLLILFLSFLVRGQSGIELPEVYQPSRIEVRDNLLFVSDSRDYKIKIFDLEKQGKLLLEFGKKGEGPGEFPWSPDFKTLPDKIFTASGNKILLFDYHGSLLSETSLNLSTSSVFPIKENYFGMKLVRTEDGIMVVFRLLDANCRVLKELHSGRGLFRKDRKRNLFEVFFFDTTEDMILFAHMDGSGVEICDSSGKTLRKIATGYPSLPFTAEDRDSVYKYWDETPPYKENKDNWRRITVFPDCFPTILTCRLDGETLCVITYQRKNGRFLTHIYNLEGKELGETWLPIRYTVPVSYMITPFTISGGRLFQLVEDETSGNWCVRINGIEKKQ